MKNFIKDIQENLIDYIFITVFITGILLIIFLISAHIYNLIYVKDEITCLGGHYEWRYNINLKTNMRHFVCDSAKIIYK